MSASTLSLLLERAEAERDAAAQALHAASAQAQAARHQQTELAGYRQEYQQRWTQQFASGTTMSGRDALTRLAVAWFSNHVHEFLSADPHAIKKVVDAAGLSESEFVEAMKELQRIGVSSAGGVQ